MSLVAFLCPQILHGLQYKSTISQHLASQRAICFFITTPTQHSQLVACSEEYYVALATYRISETALSSGEVPHQSCRGYPPASISSLHSLASARNGEAYSDIGVAISNWIGCG